MNALKSRFEAVRRTLREDGALKSVLKNTGWLTGSGGIIIVLSTIQGMLTARLLGVAVWGTLAIAMSFSAVFAKLLSFRMNDFVIKWVTQLTEDGSQRGSTAFKAALIGDVGSALIAFVLVELLAGWGAVAFAKNADFATVFRLTGLIILFQAGRETLLGILQVHRDFRVMSVVPVICQAVTVSGVVVVFAVGWGLYAVVAVLVAGEAVAASLYWGFGARAANAVLEHGWVRSKLVRLGELEREMWHFALLTNVSGTLKLVQNEGDVLILGFLSNPTYVAYYKLARSIAEVVYLPMMPLVTATYPDISSSAAGARWDEFRRLLRHGTTVAAAWFVPASLGTMLLAPFAIRILYGKSFVPAAPVLDMLLIGVALNGIVFWTGSALLSLGEAAYVARNSLEVAGVKIVLAVLLVPTWGAMAMAFSATAALSAMNILAARRVYKVLRMRESAALPGDVAEDAAGS